MKKITVENYEARFLDYIEGHLDAATLLELEAFLDANPQLKEDLERITSFQLAPESFVFERKDELKKFQFENQFINKATFNDFCIAAHEGLLSEKKREELANFMQTDPSFFAEYVAYGKTILKPETIVFPSRNKLYRKVAADRRLNVWIWASVAAGIALLVSLYIVFFTGNDSLQPPTISQISTIKVNKVPTTSRPVEVVTSVKAKAKPSRSSVEKVKQPIKAQNEDNVDKRNEDAIESMSLHQAELVVVPSIAKVIEEDKDSIIAVGQKEPANNVEASRDKRKLLALVEEGIEKINKVTNSDNLALAHQTTSTGEIKSFRIKLGFIGFERKKARN